MGRTEAGQEKVNGRNRAEAGQGQSKGRQGKARAGRAETGQGRASLTRDSFSCCHSSKGHLWHPQKRMVKHLPNLYVGCIPGNATLLQHGVSLECCFSNNIFPYNNQSIFKSIVICLYY